MSFENYLELEDMNYQFERINNLTSIIKSNYYYKNNVSFNNFEDYYDLCISYKDVSEILDVITEIATSTNKKFNDFLSKQKNA